MFKLPCALFFVLCSSCVFTQPSTNWTSLPNHIREPVVEPKANEVLEIQRAGDRWTGPCVVERTVHWDGKHLRRELHSHDLSGRVTQTYEVKQSGGEVREVVHIRTQYDSQGEPRSRIRREYRAGRSRVAESKEVWKRSSSMVEHTLTHDVYEGRTPQPDRTQVEVRRTALNANGQPVLELRELRGHDVRPDHVSRNYREWLYDARGQEIWHRDHRGGPEVVARFESERADLKGSTHRRGLRDWLLGKANSVSPPFFESHALRYVRRDDQGRIVLKLRSQGERYPVVSRTQVTYDAQGHASVQETQWQESAHAEQPVTTSATFKKGSPEHRCLVGSCSPMLADAQTSRREVVSTPTGDLVRERNRARLVVREHQKSNGVVRSSKIWVRTCE